MKTTSLSQSRLAEIVAGFSRSRIAVLGDFFLDKYLDVDPDLGEPSVETGKVAHQVVGVRTSPGAAGTVVSNLAALGAGTLHAVGFTGEDGEGFDLRKELGLRHCSTKHLHHCAVRATPTYLKPRDASVESLEAEHSRYDTKNLKATPKEIEQQIIASLNALAGELDAVIVLDQVDLADSGVVTAAIREALTECAGAHPRCVFWADSRQRIDHFRGLIIKPNQFEVMGIEKPEPGAEVPLAALLDRARALRAQTGAPLVLTRAEHGMLVSDPDWTRVPGVSVDPPLDPTGAGDSATAGTVLALCSGATLPEAALIGNLVASITIQQINTTGTATPEQLTDRLALWHEQQEHTRDG